MRKGDRCNNNVYIRIDITEYYSKSLACDIPFFLHSTQHEVPDEFLNYSRFLRGDHLGPSLWAANLNLTVMGFYDPCVPTFINNIIQRALSLSLSLSLSIYLSLSLHAMTLG